MNLTQETIDKALYEGRSHMSKGGRKRWSRHVLWDDEMPGFGLNITSTNRKSFVVSYRSGKRKRTKTLGTTDKLTLDEARQKAVEFLGTVTTKQPEAGAENPAIEGIDTVAQLADVYLEQYLKLNVPSWFADQRLMRTHIKPAMGRSPVSEVTQIDLGSLARRVSRRFPADGRRLKTLLEEMFAWAADRGMWSMAPDKKRSADAAPQEPTAADDTAETPSEPPPLPPAEELAESLRQSEEQRQELAARLEEVSTSGVEMLGRITQQAEKQKELEAELASTTRSLGKAQAEAAAQPDPEKAKKQVDNLRQSVEQLMESLAQAEHDRDTLAEKLSRADARAEEQSKSIAAVTRSRNKLEDKLREEERLTALRRVQRTSDRGRTWVGWLAGGLVGGVLLTLLLQALFSPDEATRVPAAADRSVLAESDRSTATSADSEVAPGTAAEPGPAAASTPTSSPGGGASPATSEAAPGNEGAPDFSAAETAVRAWAAAWSDQRADDYLAAYSARFEPPGGMRRGEWAAQRRTRILRPASIEVTVAALDQTVTGADRVRVSFEQSYRTPTYTDTVLKTLDLAWEDGSWKIVAERVG